MLLSVYKAVCIGLYLFLSSVLLYNRLVRRWATFSVAFLSLYVLGGYVFFGTLVVDISAETLHSAPYFLFFFGALACIGYGFLRQLSFRQIFGIVLGFLFVLAAGVFVFRDVFGVNLGVPTDGAVQRLLTGAPLLCFVLGTPLLAGFLMYRAYPLNEIVGACVMFSFFLLAVAIAGNNYFGQEFHTGFNLGSQARGALELGSVALAVLGLPAVIGYGLIAHFCWRDMLGALFLFLVMACVVVGFTYLATGYQIIGRVLTSGN